MANAQYLSTRKKYGRPQAMIWSENSGMENGTIIVPDGDEVGQQYEDSTVLTSDQFMILTDDNRESLDFKSIRIEKRERMVNGRMRSYHIADKLTLSTSWNMIPSRAFSAKPAIVQSGESAAGTLINIQRDGLADPDPLKGIQYTTDGGAGGAEILDWYQNHKGPFWVFLAYDKYIDLEADDNQYSRLTQYNDVIQMYITDFSYTVEKRGGRYDFWNISVTLEEV